MSHHHNHEVSGKNLGIAILLNILITIVQVIGGIISGSMALISDATHNLSDVISLVISYIAKKMTVKKATERQTFGRKRAEIMAAFINSATLIVMSVFILFEATQRLFEQKVIKADYVIYLALLSIVINGVSVLFIKKDAKGNINIRSAYLHLFSDMLTSIAVFGGGLAMKYYNLFWIDPVLSIGIGIYLLYVSWDIFKKSSRIMMQYTPDGIDINKIVVAINRVAGVKNLHHIHIWQLNEHDIMFESHVDLKEDISVSEFEKIMQQIETILKGFNINHSTLQPEFDVDDDKEIIHK